VRLFIKTLLFTATVGLILLLHCSGDLTIGASSGGSEVTNPITGSHGDEIDLDSLTIIVVPRE
jgi:hypothetical protein